MYCDVIHVILACFPNGLPAFTRAGLTVMCRDVDRSEVPQFPLRTANSFRLRGRDLGAVWPLVFEKTSRPQNERTLQGGHKYT